MKISHGVRLYAVDSRDVGTFGGRAAKASIKIYDGSCATVPRTTISGEMVKSFRRDVEKLGRGEQIEQYLRTLLPSNDPYRLPAEG